MHVKHIARYHQPFPQACSSLHCAWRFSSSILRASEHIVSTKIVLFHENGKHAYSIRHLRCSTTISVDNKQQKSCTAWERRQIISLTKHAKKQLSNLAIFERIKMDEKKGSENLANLPCIELADSQVFAGSKLTFGYLWHLPRHFLFHPIHNIPRRGNGGLLTRYQDILHEKCWTSTITLAYTRNPWKKNAFVINYVAAHFYEEISKNWNWTKNDLEGRKTWMKNSTLDEMRSNGEVNYHSKKVDVAVL